MTPADADSRPTRNGLGLPLAVGAVGLVLIGLGQGIPNRHSIEDTLTKRATGALQAAGLTGKVSLEGRDATVRIPAAGDRDHVRAVVERLQGIRIVQVEVSAPTAAAPRSPTVELTLNNGHAVLTGTVSSDTARGALVQAATTAFGPVDDRLEIDPAIGDTGLSGLAAVFPTLGSQVPQGSVALRGGVMTLTGSMPSREVHDAVVSAATSATGNAAQVVDNTTVAAATMDAGAVEQQVRALAPLTFVSDSAALTPQAQAIVGQIAAILAKAPGVTLGIEGYTDDDGDANANLALSVARAQTVRNALTTLGIAADRTTATGFGETHAKVPNTTEENKQTNRRVEFVAR